MLRETRNSIIPLAGMSTVSTVCMHRWKRHKLWLHKPHPSMQANSLLELTTTKEHVMATWTSNLPRQRTDLEAQWEQACQNVRWKCVSTLYMYGHSRLCIRHQKILTHCEPSKVVLESIFCALQERTQIVDTYLEPHGIICINANTWLCMAMNAMEIWVFAIVILIIHVCMCFILLTVRLKTYSYQFTDLQ